jgi:hypothetical protein
MKKKSGKIFVRLDKRKKVTLTRLWRSYPSKVNPTKKHPWVINKLLYSLALKLSATKN